MSAESAYFAMDLGSSRRILLRLIESKSVPPKDVAGALRRLAIQDWLFYRDYAAAEKRLRQADSLGVERSATWTAMSRIAGEAGHYGEAQAAARKAMELAESKTQTGTATVALSKAVLEEAADSLEKGGQPDAARLDKAHRMMSAILLEEPGEYRASKILLGISLLRRDGPTALSAWRHYFHLRSGQAANGVLEDPGKDLNAVLGAWNGSGLARQDRIRLVSALADSRFFHYAALLARDRRLGAEPIAEAPAVREVLNYANFLTQVQRMTEDYYRDVALGKGKEGAYKKALEAAFVGLWQRLDFPRERPAYSRARFLEEVRARFGAELRLGANGNFSGFDLIMGHRVGAENQAVEQYGRRVQLRLLTIDMMVENGYSGWFWDGRATPGGWGAFSEIAQIRQAYLQEPYRNWRQLVDAQERSRKEQEIERFSAMDDRLARENRYAYLPGMTGRLYFAAVKRLYDSLKSRGLSGSDLCLAFVTEFLRIKTEATIFAHEGRHAIDEASFPLRSHWWSMEQMEFRAKLSEVAFAPDPKFALVGGSVLSDPNIAGRSGHSAANLRIKKMLLEWIEKHSSEIPGIDLSRPPLTQLDLLTNEQIIRVCRQADPMATAAP